SFTDPIIFCHKMQTPIHHGTTVQNRRTSGHQPYRAAAGMRIDTKKCLLHFSVLETPSTIRVMPKGFPSCSSSGKNVFGQFWNANGRTKRLTASGPTDVNRGSVDDGKGPPCCMA